MSHTGNPRHPNNPPSDYPSEPTGAIAKDSLANESIQSGGAFADNDNAQALGVKGYQSTLATEDTSNAEVLHPAKSGAAREAQDFKGLGSDERGEVGTRYPDPGAGKGYEGTFSDQGYRGGSGDAGVSANYTSSSDQAPNYTADLNTEGELKPKGENLVEGGDIPPNRSTYTGDVGGPKDPGRLAEQNFALSGADSSGGSGARQYGNVAKGGDDTIYDNLNSSERA